MSAQGGVKHISEHISEHILEHIWSIFWNMLGDQWEGLKDGGRIDLVIDT
jgi:hypothetical protein